MVQSPSDQALRGLADRGKEGDLGEMTQVDAETIMRAAAHGVLVAFVFLTALRFLWGLRRVPKDAVPSEADVFALIAATLAFAYSGWWMFGDIISGFLAFQ